MKKILLSIASLLVCTTGAVALENEPEEGISWMGLLGMNVSKLQNSDYGAKVGARLGVRMDYVLPSAHGTYVTAGIDWSMKGGKSSFQVMDASNQAYDASFKYNLHYFEIPVRVGFRYNIIKELGIYGEVGPYFAVGVGGKHKCSIGDGTDISAIEDEYTFKAFRNSSFDQTHPGNLTYQRWDAGIGFRVGAVYNEHYNLMLGCDWGLCDLYPGSLRNVYRDKMGEPLPRVRNFNFNLSFGYRF